MKLKNEGSHRMLAQLWLHRLHSTFAVEDMKTHWDGKAIVFRELRKNNGSYDNEC
jgi:hypothetical protein